MLLVTGSSGLIGSALGQIFDAEGIAWRPFDLRNSAAEDTRNQAAIANALKDVSGIVHLAAVSRVVWAEHDPALTEAVNVQALKTLITEATKLPHRPWLLFASSREVYGEQDILPVREDAQLRPMNTYARSKVLGESLTSDARENGFLTQVIRFSNVYGNTLDHHDRVVPAFARSAANGEPIRIDGSGNMFDFTHVEDSARGLFRACEAMMAGEHMPPIHFLTGRGTTLGELADLALDASHMPIELVEAPSRKFDVSRFHGDPARAKKLLGWEPTIDIEVGFKRLVDDFRREAALQNADSAEPIAAHAKS